MEDSSVAVLTADLSKPASRGFRESIINQYNIT